MSALAAVSVRDAIDGAATAIGAAGVPTPRLDAELLLADAMGTTRERLHLDPAAAVAGAAAARFRAHVRRRAATREPVAYILGRRSFRWLELSVDARVLVPRPETELLVQVALEALEPGARVLDCCCGGGAVALALAHERPDLDVTGSDLDAGALAVAEQNSARLGLAVRWRRADLLAGASGRFDAVIANPPYVASGDIDALEPEISRHEPRLALDGGPSGLEVSERLIAQAGDARIPMLALEHGQGQEEALAALCARAGFRELAHHTDLGGVVRVLLARR